MQTFFNAVGMFSAGLFIVVIVGSILLMIWALRRSGKAPPEITDREYRKYFYRAFRK